MKKLCSLILALIIVSGSALRIDCAEVTASASAAVLYCADNGEVYYSKNENKRIKPASTTKLLTTLITLEHAAENNKKVEFTREMLAEGSSMYLKIGEVVTLKDLAVGLMLCSGNDAANAAAVAIAGSKEKFSELMNRRAAELGMKDTHFVTPSGLDDDNHYTTARDMAVLMTAALKNKAFAKLTAKKSETVHFCLPKNKIVTYSNHNRLLSLYEYCIGGKTGYTMAAGRCLVSAARRDGLTFVAATFNDKRDWDDHISLYNYGFSLCSMNVLDDRDLVLDVETVGGERDKTAFVSDGLTKTVLPRDESKIERKVFLDNFLYAPIRKGDERGTVKYFCKGKLIVSHKLVAAENNNSVSENKLWFF